MKQEKLSLMNIVNRLTTFWHNKGCVRVMPYDIEMGAATFHPEVVKNCFSKIPKNIVFFQPCRRPQDARGNISRNRLYVHHQLEVIMSPPPQDIQKLTQESLYLCGIDPKTYSIQFNIDNWKSPSMGAAGKGYEVKVNGMEVCQFTYFQQMLGETIEPGKIPIELAYGLERLSMVSQNIDNVYDLVWEENGDEQITTYRDIRGAFEQECVNMHSKTNLIKLIDIYESMAKVGSFYNSYEYFVKMSHAFNLIEATGSLSYDERESMIKRVRNCSKFCMNRKNSTQT